MKIINNKYCLIFIALILFGCGWWGYKLIWGQPLSINHFYERIFINYLLDDPELLSSLGLIDNTLLDFHSDDLTDASPARTQQVLQQVEQSLTTLRSYDRQQQSAAQQLSSDILDWFLDDQLRAKEFMYHNYAVNQLSGVHISLPLLMDTVHKVINKHSAENYISRLSKFGIKIDQAVSGLKLRADQGIILPKIIITKIIVSLDKFTSQPVTENILYTSFKKKLSAVAALDLEQKTQLSAAAHQQILTVVYPAYKKLSLYLTALSASATADAGVWKLPNGDAYYAYKLRSNTTLNYSPQQVHQLGLEQVALIHKEIQDILQDLGYTGNNAMNYMRKLTQDKRFLFTESANVVQQIIQTYQDIITEIDRNIGDLFHLRPQAQVEVRAIPKFSEKTAVGAYYLAPAMDNSRPGVFYVNLRNTGAISKPSMRTLAYHEAIPGHHFQKALQQEMQNVPSFRKVLPFTAYIEGWALYAERLAWEQGFQHTPYDKLGYLNAQLFRAVRLVVDTGIHYKKWSRQRAIDYMFTNTAILKEKVITEIERYIVTPGQACAYYIGMLKILELRDKVKQQLGSKFDIANFHDLVLQNGAMPLELLEQLVESYLASQSN
jgi:uncharacterized protein (DUF885 family)